MKHNALLITALAAFGTSCKLSAAEQVLVNWNQSWAYYQPKNVDPAVAYPNFNGTTSAAGAWFAKESDFVSATGYKTLVGKGFNIDGTHTYATDYDGGVGPGPLGYDAIVYFGAGGAEMTAFGTTLTQPPILVAGTNNRTAVYIRTTFTTAIPFYKPRIRMLLDDNALIYLDGVLVARVNRTTVDPAFGDTANSDTTATLNETGASAGNENVLQAFPLDVLGAGTQADSTVIVTVPSISVGTHTIAVNVRNSGVNSSDMAVGLQLLANNTPPPEIVATAGTAVYDNKGTPTVTDDEFTVPITVSVNNSPSSTSWTSNVAPPVGPPSGASGTTSTYRFSAAAAGSVTFTSVGHTPAPELTTTITIPVPTAPRYMGTNLLTGGAGTPIFATGATAWTQPIPGSPTIQQNNGGATDLGHVLTTDTITLTPGTLKCLTLQAEYEDSSTGSNAEFSDFLKIEAVTNVGTFNLTKHLDLNDGLGAPAISNYGPGAGAINGYSTSTTSTPPRADAYDVVPFLDEFNPYGFPIATKFIVNWDLYQVIPANATSLSIVITGANDSATEFQRVRNIQLTTCVDTDGDGVSDAQEAVEGTDPNDDFSFFHELDHQFNTTTNVMTISVVTSTNRAYAREISDDLGHWVREGTPVTGTGNLMDIAFAPSTSPRRQYRITVQNLPTIVP